MRDHAEKSSTGVIIRSVESDLQSNGSGNGRANGHPQHESAASDVQFLDLAALGTALGTGLDGIVSHLANVLRSPVIIQTPRFVTVASASGGEVLSLNPDRRQIDRKAVSRALDSDGPVVVPATSAMPARAVVPLHGGEEVLGYVVAGIGQSSVDRVSRALQEASAVASAQILAALSTDRSMRAERQRLVSDLVDGRSLERIAIRAAYSGHDLSQTHVPLVVKPMNGHTSELDSVIRIVADACREATFHGPESVVGMVDDSAVAFVHSGVRGSARQVGETIERWATEQGVPVFVGLGPLCTDVSEYADGMSKGRWVVGVLAALNNGVTIAAHDAIGLYGLLFEPTDPARLASYVSRCLGPLLEYDAERGTEFTRTLARMLDSDSMGVAAQALNVHISTLKYRAKRINEILGIDFRIKQTAFDLQLALKILEVKEMLECPEDPVLVATRGATRG